MKLFGVFRDQQKITVVSTNGEIHQATTDREDSSTEINDLQKALNDSFAGTYRLSEKIYFDKEANEEIYFNTLKEFWDVDPRSFSGKIVNFPLFDGLARILVPSGEASCLQIESLKLRLRTSALSERLIDAQINCDSSYLNKDLAVPSFSRPLNTYTLYVSPWDASLPIYEESILPFPGSSDWAGDRQHKPISLFGKHVGIVNHTTKKKLPEDDEFVVYQSTIAAVNRVRSWDTERVTTGASAKGKESSAYWASIGEGIERYSGNIYPYAKKVIHGSWNALKIKYPLVNPNQFVLFHPDRKPDPRFGLKDFNEDTVCNWIESEILSTNETVYIPAAMAYVSPSSLFDEEPLFTYPTLQGIAAGTSKEMAIINAIEEVVERDTTMGWWYNAPNVPSEFCMLEDDDHKSTWSLALPNKFKIPVCAVVQHRKDENLLNIGFAARNEISEAITKATTEALTLEGTQRTYLDPNGVTNLSRKKIIDLPYLKKWRADRMYLDDYSSDFSDVGSLMNHPQIALDLRAQSKLTELLYQKSNTVVSNIEGSRTLDYYKDRVESHGYQIIVTDLTTKDVAACGWHVIRVTIPGLIPNTPAGFPMLGNDRWAEYAIENDATPLNVSDVNLWPLPHA